MAERLTIEHYIGEAFVKIAQVILGSRLFTASRGAHIRVQRDKKAGRWFHLELDDVDMAREAEAWRKDTSAPMVVEVYVQHPPLSRPASGRHVDYAACAAEAYPAVEVLVERWTVQYVKGAGAGAAGAAGGSGSGAAEGSTSGGGGGGGGGGGSGSRTYLDETSVYKRLVILIRSLYSYTRVLPAHKLYRASKRHLGDHPSGFRLACRISRSTEGQQQQVGSSMPPSASSSAHCSSPTAPQPRMQHFMFAPVDTLGGQFRAAVQFLPASSGAMAFLAAAEDQAVSAVGIGVAASPPVLVPGAGAAAGAGPGGVGAHIIPDYYANSHGAGERGPGGVGGAGLPLPSTSAPSTSSGFARPPYGPSPASSRYGGYGATGRSPPVGSGTPGGGGILRHAPSAGGMSPSGAGISGGGGAPMAVPARSIVRHAWSSKDMKVSFSLPPPFGSPGGLGAGGVAGSLGRRSSSGYGGSTPSTPPTQSPGVRAPGHPGSHSSHHHRHHSSGAATGAAPAPQGTQQREGFPVGSQPNPSHSHLIHTASRHGSGAAAAASIMGSSPPSLPSSYSGGGGGRPPLAGGRRTSSSGSAVAAAAPRSPQQRQQQQEPTDQGGSVISEGPFARASPGVGGVPAAAHAGAVRAGAGGATKAAAVEGTVTDIDVDAVLRGDIKGGDLPYRTAVAAADGGGGGDGRCVPAQAQGVERGQAGAVAAAAGAEPRGATAPVAIPGRTSCRTRSVSDLRAPAVYGGFEVKDAVAAAAAAGGWRAAAAAGQHLVEEDGGAAAASQDPFTSIASAADGTPPGSVAVTPGGGGAHCRMALGSAPAAPRGMLGLALGAMKPPAAPSGVAAAAGGSRGRGGVIVGSASAHGAWGDAGGKAVAVAAEGEEVPPGSEPKDAAAAAEGDSGGGGGAGGTSTALTVTVVQRNVTAPAAVAAAGAAGASPPGRPGAGAMVVARPGGVAVGSLAGYGSPQLPFAFTPSAASMSLASLHQAIAVPLGYFPPGSSGGTPRGALPPPGHPHAHHPQQQQAGSVSGRDITALATIKRPSWGSRSSSFDPASMGAHGMALIPAMGPLHDLLDSSSPSTTASTPNRSGTSGANAHPDAQQHQPHPHHPASAVFSLSPGSGASRGSSVGTAQQQQQQQRSSPLHPASFVSKASVEKPGAAAAAVATAAAAAVSATVDGAAAQSGTPCAAGSAGGQATAAAEAGAAAYATQDAPQDGPSPAQDASAAAKAAADATAIGAPRCGRAVPYSTNPAHAGLGGLCGLAREDSESDLLPFALDSEAPSALNPSVAAALNAAVAAAAAGGDCGGGAGTRPAGPVEVTLSIPAYTTHAERDVAVGAFVRMVAEAAPLAAPPGHPAARELTPAAALSELRELAAVIRGALQGR